MILATLQRFPASSLSVVSVGVFACTTAHALTVEIVTTNGAERSGVVDWRTDERALWLRADEVNLSLATSTPWRQIASARTADTAVNVGELRKRLLAVDSKVASRRPVVDVLLGPVQVGQLPLRTMPSSVQSSKVASLTIAAHLANWDADARTDGIELLVWATDRNGVAKPVRGNLTVRLIGRRQESRHRAAVRELHRWTEAVEPHHFGPNGQAARYRLLYRGLDPEADRQIGAAAFIEASLGVYGQGRFASRTPVTLLRHPDPIDRLDLQTTQVRFPTP